MMVWGHVARFAVKRRTESFASRIRENISSASSKVDWEDYNYPPVLQIIHYSIDDVEDLQAKSAVSWAHHSYRMLCGTLLFNMLATTALVISGVKGSFLNVLYALFNFIICGTVGLYSFYNGYKGLATNNMSLTQRYLVLQVLFVVFMLASAIAHGNNFNGLTSLEKTDRTSSKLKTMWVAWVVVESSLWLLNVGIALMGLYLVNSNRRQGRPLTFEQNALASPTGP